MAAKKLGLREVPTIELSGMTDAQKRAYILADNKLALDAGWDEELLKIELEELKTLDFDMSLTGFELDEIEELEGNPDQEDSELVDEIPEPPEEPKTQHGDVWILGRHRLMCGDSTSKAEVAVLCAPLEKSGEKADFIHADPPYGMGKESEGVENDNLYREKLDAFQMLWIKAFRFWAKEKIEIAIWGNAEELWRLWFTGGLSSFEKPIRVANELVWKNRIKWA